MKFNEKLYELRKARGLSQDEIGDRLQVSRQTVSKWETGQSYPDFQRLVLLSDYFEITIDELVKDIDVQNIRDQGLSNEKIISMHSDVEKFKRSFRQLCIFSSVILGVLLTIAAIAVVVNPVN